MKMRVAMQSAHVWEATQRTDVDFDMDREALFAIYSAVPDTVMSSLAGRDTAKAAWDAIKTSHVGHDRVREASLQSLRKDFEELQMGDAESVDDFASRISALVAGIRALGDTLSELRVVQKFLQAAPAHYMQIVTSIEQCVPLNTLTVEDLVSQYKAHDERVRQRFGNPKDGEHLMLSRSQWENFTGNKRKNVEGTGNWAKAGSSSSGAASAKQSTEQAKGEWKFDKKNNCGKKGHFKKECKKPRKERAMVAEKENGDEEPALLMVQTCELMQSSETVDGEVFLNEEKVQLKARNAENYDRGVSYLDTGATNHMTGVKEKFSDIDETVKGKVKFGDGSTVAILGRGTILFQCKNGEHRALTNVYYIPSLKSNIINIGQLSEKGCKIVIEDDYLLLYDPGRRLLARVKRARNRLYILDLSLTRPICLMANTGDAAWIWHARYGHLNFDALHKLARKNMVVGLPQIDHIEQICDGCLIGKQRRKPFPGTATFRAEQPLALLHADLCGPVTPPTPAGNRYFLLVVDDYSRYMWIVLLKSKDQALAAIHKVKKKAEKEVNCELKSLRTDRGGEFNSMHFNEYCDEHGIKHFLTAPYSPQQNGVVERRNQTVVSMARSLLKSMSVPGIFWGEAVLRAVYILNRAPTKSVKDRTPYEAWFNKKPKIHHLRTFGCVAYVKITKPNQSKLDDRSQRAVLIGYKPLTKAYRLFDPVTKKVIVSPDVVFDEKRHWDWSEVTELEMQGGGNEFTVVYPTYDVDTRKAQRKIEQSDQSSDVAQNAPALGNDEPSAPNKPSTPLVPILGTTGSAGVGMESGEQSSSVGPQGYRNMQELLHNTSPCTLDLDDDNQCMLSAEEPATLAEAHKEACWRKAMDEEMKSVIDNQTWVMVDPPTGKKSIGLKWVYKVKKDPTGAIVKHKARLVAKGYVQKHGVDFEEVFAPVARMESVRLAGALASQEGWQVYHMDVKSAFLNGELHEEVYVCQAPGYEEAGKEYKVLKLQKALYGLKQAPRVWNTKLDASLLTLGFARCPLEHGVYLRNTGDNQLLVGVYVDDLIISGSSTVEIEKFKEQMKELFKMSDLGLLSYYLGIEVSQGVNGITLCQAGYV